MLCSAERELQHRVGGVQPPQPRPRLLLLVLQQGRPGRPRHPPQHRADPHRPQHARVPGQPPLQSSGLQLQTKVHEDFKSRTEKAPSRR